MRRLNLVSGFTLISVFFGMLDVSLSDFLIYQGQVTRIHYVEAFLHHLILGVATGILAMIFIRGAAARAFRIWAALLLFFIAGVKIQLVWLSSTFFDADSLAATAALAAIIASL